jgi:K+-transporting ATPase KdpF subunit
LPRSSSSAGSTFASAKTFRSAMESIIVGIIALLLFLYLFVAMIRPEKF